MNQKKRNKNIEYAEYIYQKKQLKAATMQEQVDKALATIEHFKEELSNEEYLEAIEKVNERRKDIEEFLMKATKYYAATLKRLGDPRIDLSEPGE